MVLLCSLLNLNNCQEHTTNAERFKVKTPRAILRKYALLSSKSKNRWVNSKTCLYIYILYYYTYNITRLVFDVTLYLKNVFFISLWKKIPWFLWTLITDTICNTDEGRTYHKISRMKKKICARYRYLLFLLISKRKKICKHPPLFFKYRPASKFVFFKSWRLFWKDFTLISSCENGLARLDDDFCEAVTTQG